MNKEIDLEEYLKELSEKLNLFGHSVENWEKCAKEAQNSERWLNSHQKLYEEIREHSTYMIVYPLAMLYELSRCSNFKKLKKDVLDEVYCYLEH